MTYKVDDIVKVKEGTPDPDLEGSTISGWQGTIIKVQEPKSKEEKTIIDIKWDNKTLNEMPDEYLEHCGKNGLDHTEMALYPEDLELAKSRPQEALIERYIPPYLDEDDEVFVDILGTEDINVNKENLETYQEYLMENLDLNTVVTGSEDFAWEERYLFGYGDHEEYKRLKKTKPSHRDLFKITKLDEFIDEHYGLIVKVKRLSDRKFFQLPLADLKANDEKSEAYSLLQSYSSWFVNWR